MGSPAIVQSDEEESIADHSAAWPRPGLYLDLRQHMLIAGWSTIIAQVYNDG
jgi:hypothetical protein